jgi:hypothetical protein
MENVIEKRIFTIRNTRVMIDSDLALLYGIETKNLKRQVNRNIERFPEDFMFELTRIEFEFLRCQFGTIEIGDGRGKHSKYLPYAFTEQGIAMLSSVLDSKRAVSVNIQIMRLFVQTRILSARNNKIQKELSEIKRKLGKHDVDIRAIIQIIDKMTCEQKLSRKRIGF